MLDADIRRVLLQHLAAYPFIIEEIGVCGQVRCDVVALGGEMVGYEIKSDADTLRRLPRQVEWYSRVIDRAHVVTTERHLEGVQTTSACNLCARPGPTRPWTPARWSISCGALRRSRPWRPGVLPAATGPRRSQPWPTVSLSTSRLPSCAHWFIGR